MCFDINDTSALYGVAKEIMMFEMFLPVNDLPFIKKTNTIYFMLFIPVRYEIFCHIMLINLPEVI